MCGIVGSAGVCSEPVLRRAMELLAHRGPNGNGVYTDPEKRVALGHVRLAILDLSSTGHQPMVSPCGQVVLAYNGEIYNYREHREQLQAKGHTFRGTSDTEVLLRLYLEYGEGMLPRINGMFAFALWDARNGAMLVARDGMGVKPLYYTETAEAVLFASELKALLPFPQLRRQLDLAALRDQLTYLWVPAPRTAMRGVHKLQPGHAFWVRNGRITRHWQWYNEPALALPQEMDDAAAVALIRNALQGAVERQMVSDVPVGAFLSGGLDSGAVAAIAQRTIGGNNAHGPLHCFTIAMDADEERAEGMVSDLPYARRLARHLGVTLHEVHATSALVEEIPNMVWQLDEPLADPAPLNVLAIARLARQQGIPVLLSGSGGDDLFTGYRRHQLWMAEQRLAFLPKWVRALVARAARQLPTSHTRTRRLRKALGQLDLTGDARIASLFEWLEPTWVDRVLTPDVREASQHPNPLMESMRALPSSVPGLNRMLHLECLHFLADHNLSYTDKMSMASGVEVRVPLLDQQVVEAAFSLPLRMKQRGMQGKWVLREAMRGILPDSVIDRPKTGFGLPLRAWLRGPLRPLLHETLSQVALQRRGIYNPPAVAQLLEGHDRGTVDGAYALFSLMCVELWCQQFIDVTIGRPQSI
jgi:asparagine synthase (glutamine-hydrolysing)